MGLIQKKNDREEVDGIEIIGRGDTPGDIDENEVELVEGTSAEHMAAGTTAEKESERAAAKVRTCPKCGTTLQPTDKFCAGCGSKVADLFASAAPHCPNCGKEVDESMNFCIYCGTSLK